MKEKLDANHDDVPFIRNTLHRTRTARINGSRFDRVLIQFSADSFSCKDFASSDGAFIVAYRDAKVLLFPGGTRYILGRGGATRRLIP